MRKKIVYIAHPIGGDVKGNLLEVSRIYNFLSIEDKVIPFVPYYATVLSLDDSISELRSIGFSHNKAIFESGCIDEVWLFGQAISKGMAQEVEWANSLGIKVVDKTQGND